MAVDPLKTPLNRAEQLKTEPKNQFKGVKLYDVDLAIAEHMVDTVVPTLEILGESIKVPVIYGNPERWKAIKRDGFLRDKNGQVQTPIVVFKRNSIARDESLANTMNRHVSYPTISMYSKKHKYDKFSLMTDTKRPVEQYNITMPDYVSVTYDVIIWTDFTEHMNKIVEAFQYATDEYWGDQSGFKFRTKIDSFENQQEVGDGAQRIVRTTFTMTVNAYLLPEKFDNQPTTKKSLSPKKVVWGIETDLSGGNINYTKQQMYNEYSDLIDFITIRGAQGGILGSTLAPVFVNSSTIKLTNVKLPICPPELRNTYVTGGEWFNVYVNGVLIPFAKYSYSYNSATNEIQFVFNGAEIIENPNANQLGYPIETTDEIAVTGKFIEL